MLLTRSQMAAELTHNIQVVQMACVNVQCGSALHSDREANMLHHEHTHIHVIPID